jgi:molybdenum cofactor cytidylyltransferase
MEGPTDIRVVDPGGVTEGTAAQGDGRDVTIHGVVLAAGTSSRYGEANKLLERIDGTPMVVHAVRTLLATDLRGVTVVVGYEADRVEAALADEPVAIRQNDDYEAGQSTSVAEGVAVARERGADAVLLALGDMPDVDAATVELLCGAYERGVAPALAAAYEGRRGNPVLFDGRYFDALADVDGDVGGKQILVSDPDAVAIETGDPGVLADVDRPSEL